MSSPSPDDRRHMARALLLARRGRGRTSPNPMVGAVIVREGHVVGEGYHHAVGQAHAEIEALRVAGAAARGATVYVNLEPCCHRGRTGPCSEALIGAGVARVVVAMRDPNPLVSGGGLAALAAAGIEVQEGVLEEPGRRLNEGFIQLITQGRPFVTLKLAATLDGRIASPSGDSKWITGAVARRRVHTMRASVDAVAVGVGTARADDPLLTARGPRGGMRARQPRRVVFDAALELPSSARMLREPGGELILLCAPDAPSERQRALERAGAQVLRVTPGEVPGTVDMAAALRALGERGVASLLSEGGSAVATALLRAGLVDRLALFLAPKIMGDGGSVPLFGALGVERMADVFSLEGSTVERLGDDVLWTSVPARRPPDM